MRSRDKDSFLPWSLLYIMREEGDEDVCGDCKTGGMSADHGFTVMLCRECNRWDAPRQVSKRKLSQTEPDCYSLRNRDGGAATE